MKHPKNKQLSSESQFSVLPTIESAGNTLPPGLVLDPDADGGILTFIDREHYGGVHTVESGHTYTIRLGLHRKLEKRHWTSIPLSAAAYRGKQLQSNVSPHCSSLQRHLYSSWIRSF